MLFILLLFLPIVNAETYLLKVNDTCQVSITYDSIIINGLINQYAYLWLKEPFNITASCSYVISEYLSPYMFTSVSLAFMLGLTLVLTVIVSICLCLQRKTRSYHRVYRNIL